MYEKENFFSVEKMDDEKIYKICGSWMVFVKK